ATASIALADRRQIDQTGGRQRRPWIGPYGNLGAETRFTDSDVVRSGGVEIVGDELVVALGGMIRNVEGDDAALDSSALPNQLQSSPVARHQRLQQRL